MKNYSPYPDKTAQAAPAGGDGASLLGSISGIVGTASVIGGIITGVVALFSSIGISIRGKTRKLSYEQVLPIAIEFQGRVYSALVNAYGHDPAFQRIAEKVPQRFATQMQAFWGLGPSLNQQILYDLQANIQLERHLGLFIIWVGTNTDADRPDEFQQFVRDLFVMIFGAAIADAGYDPLKLAPVSATLPGGNTQPIGQPVVPAKSEAGIFSSATLTKWGGPLLAAGILAFLVFKAR